MFTFPAKKKKKKIDVSHRNPLNTINANVLLSATKSCYSLQNSRKYPFKYFAQCCASLPDVAYIFPTSTILEINTETLDCDVNLTYEVLYFLHTFYSHVEISEIHRSVAQARAFIVESSINMNRNTT